MRGELEGLVHELRQLRREGVKSIPIAPETLGRLRRLVAAEAASVPVAVAPVSAAPAVAVADLPPEFRGKPSPAVPVAAAVAQNEGFKVAPIPDPPAVTLPKGNKEKRRSWLREKVLGDPVCREHLRPGKQVVFGVGSVEARILFCGEAPGAEEEEQGEPFVGPAGQLLTRIIGAMGLKREEVYIANIMNWRPEMPSAFGNRAPNAEEMAYCLPYLRAQVAIVAPEVIVALGKTALDGLVGPDPKRKMGQARGKWLEFEGIPVLPTYHPSYLLRNTSSRTKREVWEDMMRVMERLEMPISEKQRGYFL